MFWRCRPPIDFGLSALIPPASYPCERGSHCSVETPIASAIADWIQRSRGATLCYPSLRHASPRQWKRPARRPVAQQVLVETFGGQPLTPEASVIWRSR